MSPISAQIHLTFLDLWTDDPINRAVLKMNDKEWSSNDSGQIKLDLQFSDTLEIEVTKDNYYNQNIFLSPDKKIFIIYLQPIEQSTGILVTSERPRISNIEIPGANTIFKLDRTSQLSGKDLADILEYSTGIFIKDYGSNSALKTVSFRGLAAEQTVFAYDGITLNNAQLGLQDLSVTGITNAGQIEVYRGGNSSLFGSGAAAGAINLIPAPIRSHFFYNYSAGIGSWEKKSTSLELHFPVTKLKQKLFVNYRSSKGDFSFTLKDRQYNRINNASETYGLNYGFDLSKFNVEGELIYNHSERGIPKQVLTNFRKDDEANQKDENYLIKLKWLPGLQMDMQAYWIKQNTRYTDPLLLINNQPIESRHDDKVFGAHINKAINIFSNMSTHTKFEIENVKVNSNQAGKHDRLRWALSSIAELQTLNAEKFRMDLVGSFRWDNFSDIGSIYLPKIGSVINYNNVKWYFSIGKNFRAPTFNELYWEPGGNPDLIPEKSISIETGIVYKFKWIGDWKASTDVYRNQFENLIRWMPTNNIDIWQPLNISSVRSQGLELNLDYKNKQENILINVNYSYSETIKNNPDNIDDKTVGNQLPFVPRELVNLSLNYKLKSWLITAQWKRTSFRYSTFINEADDILPSFNVLKLGLNYEMEVFNNRINLKLQMDNILNEQFQVMFGYPMSGRSLNFNVNIYNLN